MKLFDAISAQRQTRINSTCFFLYILLLAAHIGLVWILPYFPTQDGPSHVYNLVILNDLLHGGKEWGSFFTYKLHAVPNLGFHLIAYPLLQLFSPLTTEKIFVSIYIFLMGVCVPFFLRSFDKPVFPLSFLVFPVIFNFNLMMGFYSYVVAVPAFLIALAFTWRIRNKPLLLQFALCNIAGIVIFFLHLIPFVFFMISLVITSVTNSRGKASPIRLFIGRIAIMIPLLILLAFYLVSNRSASVPDDFSYLLSGVRFMSLFADLFSFSTVSLSPWQLLPTTIGLFVVLVLLVSLARDCRSGRVQLDTGQQTVLFLAMVLTVIYFLAPFRFGGGSFFNDRFPWVILLIILPLLACLSDKASSVVRVGLISAGILSVTSNTLIFRQQSFEISTFLSGVRSGCMKGERIILYRTSGVSSRVDVLLHAPSYYGLFNGCVDLGNYETRFSYFPVHFRQEASIPTVDMYAYGLVKMDFSKYPVVMRVIGWDLKLDEKRKIGNLFDSTFVNDKLSIWKRR